VKKTLKQKKKELAHGPRKKKSRDQKTHPPNFGDEKGSELQRDKNKKKTAWPD